MDSSFFFRDICIKKTEPQKSIKITNQDRNYIYMNYKEDLKMPEVTEIKINPEAPL
jgi:hypothetical protein